MIEQEFHAERLTGVGGSDAAAVCRRSRFFTVHDVYMAKLEMSTPRPITSRMEAGIRFEPAIAQWYADENGIEIDKPDMLRHPEHKHMICHLDGIVRKNGSGPTGIIEIKMVDSKEAWRWGEPGTDQIPDDIIIQCQHNRFVASGALGVEFEQMDVPALFGGNDLRVYAAPKHDGLLGSIIKLEENFWMNHVEKSIPPDIDGSEAAGRLLNATYPFHTEEVLQANDETAEWGKQRNALRDELDEKAEQLTAIDNKIKELMQDRSIFKTPHGRFLWKRTKDRMLINHKAICEEIGVSEAIIKKYTTMKPGIRRFMPPRRSGSKTR